MTPGVSDYVAEKRKLEADLEKAKAALREIRDEPLPAGPNAAYSIAERMRASARVALEELDK